MIKRPVTIERATPSGCAYGDLIRDDDGHLPAYEDYAEIAACINLVPKLADALRRCLDHLQCPALGGTLNVEKEALDLLLTWDEATKP